MLDVVKCLREHQGEDDPPWMACIMDKAADEIERLRAAYSDMRHAAVYLAASHASPNLKDEALKKFHALLDAEQEAPREQ